MGIKNWTINNDGLVDVDGSVNLDRILGTLTQLPVQFGKVDGSFSCEHNQLANLEGSPEKVGRDFWCRYNQLVSLEGSPDELGKSFCVVIIN